MKNNNLNGFSVFDSRGHIGYLNTKQRQRRLGKMASYLTKSKSLFDPNGFSVSHIEKVELVGTCTKWVKWFKKVEYICECYDSKNVVFLIYVELDSIDGGHHYTSIVTIDGKTFKHVPRQYVWSRGVLYDDEMFIVTSNVKINDEHNLILKAIQEFSDSVVQDV